jgi:putative molybdopterin biosynthesis protein
MDKNVYLHDIPLSEAMSRLEKALRSAELWDVLGKEMIPLDEHAAGRVLAEPVWAKLSSPHYHAAAMDGFAVRADETGSASLVNPISFRTLPGQSFTPPTNSSEAYTAYVDTGDPLPDWADAVIPIENVEPVDEVGIPDSHLRRPFAIRIRSAVTPWSHVRLMGEDIVATQLVLPAGHTLRPVDLGAIAACGNTQVTVARQPRVAILPTGSELVPIGQAVQPGDIIEYNAMVLAAQVNEWGGSATRYAIIPDDFEQIQTRVIEAAREHDLILLIAGSSAGSEDYSAEIVQSLGELLVHGVAVRPGHPVILGTIRNPGKPAPPVDNPQGLALTGAQDQPSADQTIHQVTPIVGVPGYPVSAALTGEFFVEPLLARWLGRPAYAPPVTTAQLTRKLTSTAGDDDYIRVAVGKVGERMLAAPLARGAGIITSLVRADGLVCLPRGTQGLPAGAEVKVSLYRPVRELEQTIFVIGSHDISLDIMAQYLALRNRRLVSANVGSLGGLMAIRRGETHLAGSHLLDPQSGEYNLSYIREYLPGVPVRVIAFVGRRQGLLVAKGNPKAIRSLDDLTRPEVVYVNRQRGAGTRVLLDYQLDKKGIASELIRGYNQEEYTHLAVAAAVASGRADCGLGIAAAAQALDLSFVPLFDERYDLIIPVVYAQTDLLAPLFAVLDSREFRNAVAALPGYDPSVMGTLIAEL